jgi:hypothetical protein
MLSPARLSLRIPESPIEKQAFRSRSFRRIILIVCVFSLVLATVHSISFRNDLHRKLTNDRLNYQHNSRSFNPLSSLQQLGSDQVLLDTPKDKPEEKHQTVKQLLKQLPEVIRIPFEEAVGDVELAGWEDEWFSTATYNHEEFGNLKEPKIDFVYNCKYSKENR